MTLNPLEVVEPPSRVDGDIARIVSDGETAWVEVWSGPAKGWVHDPRIGITVRDVMCAPPASPAILAALGVTA